jgi:hypothetical protein
LALGRPNSPIWCEYFTQLEGTPFQISDEKHKYMEYDNLYELLQSDGAVENADKNDDLDFEELDQSQAWASNNKEIDEGIDEEIVEDDEESEGSEDKDHNNDEEDIVVADDDEELNDDILEQEGYGTLWFQMYFSEYMTISDDIRLTWCIVWISWWTTTGMSSYTYSDRESMQYWEHPQCFAQTQSQMACIQMTEVKKVYWR